MSLVSYACSTQVLIPRVYRHLSTDKLIVMELVEGVPLLHAAGMDPGVKRRLMQSLVLAFGVQVCVCVCVCLHMFASMPVCASMCVRVYVHAYVCICVCVCVCVCVHRSCVTVSFTRIPTVGTS